MSRVRWILAGVLALVAAIATVQALLTYIEHRLVVGVLAVLALAVTLGVGLFSLAQARRRIERELGGLRAQPPHGDLIAARLRRLEAIKKTGSRPDPEALAERSAAEEAGQAYIGRYLVATTLLIGLVGTFAGLMETMGKVAPLLSENSTGGLAILAAPLAGLQITFGASLVAILATLALSLAQGDLVLHEELALATLQDLSTHELIPRMWPAGEDGADRTVRAIGELKQQLERSFGDALVRSLEKNAGKMAAETRAESERAAKALETAATTIEKQIKILCDTVASNLTEGGRRQTAVITEGAIKQADLLAKSAAATAEIVAKNTAAQAQALETLRSQMKKGIDDANAQYGDTFATASSAVAARLGEAAMTVLSAMRTDLENAVTRSLASADQSVQRTLTVGAETLAGANAAAEASAKAAAAAAEAASTRAADAAVQAAERAASAAAEASAKVAEVAALAIERASTGAAEAGAKATGAALQASTAAAQNAALVIERAGAAVEASLASATNAANEVATRAALAVEEAIRRGGAAAEEASARGTTLAETAVAAVTERLAGSVQPLFAAESERLEAVRVSLGEIATHLESASGRLDGVTTVVAELGHNHTSTLEATSQSVLAAFDRAVVGGGNALDQAAGVLAQAARDLRQGTEGFAPTISHLANELGALGREVALLAARAQEGDTQLVLMGELERLGSGVDRLTALYELASGRMPAPLAELGAEPAASPVEILETAVAASEAEVASADQSASDPASEAADASESAPAASESESAPAAASESDTIAVAEAGERAPEQAPIEAADVTAARSSRGKRKGRGKNRGAEPSAAPAPEAEGAAVADTLPATDETASSLAEEPAEPAVFPTDTPTDSSDDIDAVAPAGGRDEGEPDGNALLADASGDEEANTQAAEPGRESEEEPQS